MKNYNKLPFKERQRHIDYVYKHEEKLVDKEIKRLIEEKMKALRDCVPDCVAMSDKQQQEEEAFNILKRIGEQK